MPKYKKIYPDAELEIHLHKLRDKSGGKNQGPVDGFYHGTDGREYFIKQPQDKVELFTELFAGLLIEEFKRAGLIPAEYHDCLITADVIELDDGSYALIQPCVNFTELYREIGTGYADNSDRNPLLEMFAGPSYYRAGLERMGFWGLPTILLFSLLLGDNSVHSGNVVCLNDPVGASPGRAASSSSQPPLTRFARIDFGASFRHFADPANNDLLLTPREHQGSGLYKRFTKAYLANYAGVPGLFEAVVSLAESLGQAVDKKRLRKLTYKALKRMPLEELLDDDTQIRLANDLSMPAFLKLRQVGTKAMKRWIAAEFTKIFLIRLANMPTLLPMQHSSELSNTIATLPVDMDTSFERLIADWNESLFRFGELRTHMVFNETDETLFQEKFHQYVYDLTARIEACDYAATRDHIFLEPVEREATTLRRRYLSYPQTDDEAFIPTAFQVQPVSPLRTHLDASLFAATRVMQSVARNPVDSVALRAQIVAFINAHEHVLRSMPAASPLMPAMAHGSHHFYPITDTGLNLLTDERVRELCRAELGAGEPSPLLARIICDEQRYERLADLLSHGQPGLWHELVVDFRIQTRQPQAGYLQEAAAQLPPCFRSVLADQFAASVPDAQALSDWRMAITSFKEAALPDKTHAIENLQRTFAALNPVLQSLHQSDMDDVANEMRYVICLQPGQEGMRGEDCCIAYNALTRELQQHYRDSYKPLRDLNQQGALAAPGSVAQALDRLEHLKLATQDDVLRQKLVVAATHDQIFWQALVNLEAMPSETVLRDMLRLSAFCATKKQTNPDDRSYCDSLDSFYRDALMVRTSSQPLPEQTRAIKQSAQTHFRHRNPLVVRLLGDALLLLASFFGVGLCIGGQRVMTGRHYFFSPGLCQREQDFHKQCLAGNREDGALFSDTVLR